MTYKYEYTLATKDTNEELDFFSTRSDARREKQLYKQNWNLDTKIVQKKFKLESQKEIR